MEITYNISPMKDLTGYLTEEQVDLLIQNAPNRMFGLLFKTLFRTDRRVSEVVGGKLKRKLKQQDRYGNIIVSSIEWEHPGLRPKHILWNEGLVKWTIIKKKKGWEEALDPIDSELLDELKAYVKDKKIGEDERIFPISKRRVDQVIKAIGKKIGLERIGEKGKPIHIHLLRHSFMKIGAENAEKPEDIIKLKEMAHHSSLDTSMFYFRNFNPESKRILLDRMFKKKPLDPNLPSPK